DVEYVVQALQLVHGSSCASIRQRNTLEALRGLVENGILDSQTGETLQEGYDFFRKVDQGLRLLDETREPVFELGSLSARQLARQFGFSQDASANASDERMLTAAWQRCTTRLRETFEKQLGKVGTPPPWVRLRN